VLRCLGGCVAESAFVAGGETELKEVGSAGEVIGEEAGDGDDFFAA